MNMRGLSLGVIRRKCLYRISSQSLATRFVHQIAYERQFESTISFYDDKTAPKILYSFQINGDLEDTLHSISEKHLHESFIKFHKDRHKQPLYLSDIHLLIESIPHFGKHVCDSRPSLASLYYTILPHFEELNEICYSIYNIVQLESLISSYQQYLLSYEQAKKLNDIKLLPLIESIQDYHRRFTLSEERVNIYNTMKNELSATLGEYFEQMKEEKSDVEYQVNMILTQVLHNIDKNTALGSPLVNKDYFNNLLQYARTHNMQGMQASTQLLPLHTALEKYSSISEAIQHSRCKLPLLLVNYLTIDGITNKANQLSNIITQDSVNILDSNDLSPVARAIFTEIGLNCASSDIDSSLVIRPNYPE